MLREVQVVAIGTIIKYKQIKRLQINTINVNFHNKTCFVALNKLVYYWEV